MSALLQSDCPTAPLYHYTSTAGFYGIVRRRSLWMSHIRYLNDSAEFSHAVDEAIRYINDRAPGRSAMLLKLTELVRTRLDSLSPADYFVGSFSRDGDLLSQWRSYTFEATGFSVGFESSVLAPHLARQGFILKRCLYTPEEKEALIQNIIDEILDFDELANATSRQLETAADEFMRRFLALAPIFKDESFREEGEWRCFIGPTTIDHPQVEFRKDSHMIIPYFDFRLSSAELPFSLANVVIGPNTQRELALASTKAFLRKHGVSCSVQPSRISYRSW